MQSRSLAGLSALKAGGLALAQAKWAAVTLGHDLGDLGSTGAGEFIPP